MVVTANVREGPSPQELDGVTVIFPEEVPQVVVMLFVPCPFVIDQPDGTAQVKVTPLTLVTL